MGLFSKIIQAFKDAEARRDADKGARTWAEQKAPWDSRRHFCLDCAKATGDLPVDYHFDARSSTIQSISHLPREERGGEFQRIMSRAEKLQGSRLERQCDIHDRYNAIWRTLLPENSPQRLGLYCFECAKEHGEVTEEDNEFSLPLKPSGQSLIGERVIGICKRHADLRSDAMAAEFRERAKRDRNNSS